MQIELDCFFFLSFFLSFFLLFFFKFKSNEYSRGFFKIHLSSESINEEKNPFSKPHGDSSLSKFHSYGKRINIYTVYNTLPYLILWLMIWNLSPNFNKALRRCKYLPNHSVELPIFSIMFPNHTANPMYLFTESTIYTYSNLIPTITSDRWFIGRHFTIQFSIDSNLSFTLLEYISS